jgi:hypothetical protein
MEPWIGTGTDMSWVDPLIDDYQQAATRVSGSGMPLVADVSGVKIKGATLQQRQDMLDAVTRLVLMQYEIANVATAESRTEAFLTGLTISADHGFLVAVRAQDLPPVTDAVADIDAHFNATTGYCGWAIYDYCSAIGACGP